jgi:glycosyltransferase involved in cell wall biosynthesis
LVVRVGIDARFLTHPQYGGFKSYTRALTFALAEAGGDNEYILYTDRPSDPGLQLPPNFRLKPVPSGNGIIREQALLPLAMKRDRLDVAHFPCNTSPVIPGPAMVVTIHDAIPLHHRRSRGLKGRLLQSYWRAMIPRSADRAALVITDSAHARDDIIPRLSLPADKVRVVYMAVDPVFTSLARRIPPAGLDAMTPFILAFASPDGRKNHRTAIEAYRAAGLDASGTKLALVCSHLGVLADVKREAIEGIIPLGPVATPELVWLYKNALVLLFPSLDEGFGLPPLEAMTCGAPVVASNAGSLPEVLADAALYTDPTDAGELANSVRLILQDESLRAELIRRGHERASGFTRETMGRELAAIYSEAASL